MENIRLILILLHALITIFLICNLYFYLSCVGNSSKYIKQSSLIITCISDIFRISLYHSSCVIAILSSRRYGAGMICGTGILLIGELLQITTMAIQQIIEKHDIGIGQLLFYFINLCVILAAMILTFRLAKKIFKHQKDLMQVELLATSVSEASMSGEGEFSIV
ncbi:unnamed protein product [Rotaria magnacalcarata]|uniref:Uncharacterized protein n=1 Tax=Rotaria magnacalcarata TaxID=392030 RepID=A0A815CMM4_9BILA|nr:unnamed protein product [Rotaria magnacalcarata]CAF1682032.1 unnamed protein product [Rotaria magnacalcarata]CAF2135449.1 unnamed protein product [Rotaria magnacalcarata]CAF3948380.1 unnamed protein product [Rotaria magnacalcarata]CAF5188900.1 unnamed protein product [Rotaria magnacalcarata]